MITIKRYSEEDKQVWNTFNQVSKMSLFMFDRDYMDYHKDRFTDHSLMFRDDDKLLALLPMSERGHVLTSHGGLTYGGFITDNTMKQHIMNGCFDALCAHMKEIGYEKLIYKTIPYFYHRQPAEEDRYALFLHHAAILKREASTVVSLSDPLPWGTLRKRQKRRAEKAGISIKEFTEYGDYCRFIQLQNEVLRERHGTTAVHTADELFYLHSNFPNSIRLFAGELDGHMIAGTVVFEYSQVVHTQYLAANTDARDLGALDLVIDHVTKRYRENKLWLDFGISTENAGAYLNEGLISQKEGFGGRTVVYDTWEIQV